MVNVTAKLNAVELLGLLDQLHLDVRDRAAVSAVNKAIAKGQTRMVRVISREYNVTAGYVRERLRIERAKFVRGKAVIAAALVGGGSRGAKRSANLIVFTERSTSLAQAKKRMKAGEGGTYKLGSTTVSKALELRFKIKRGSAPKVIKGAFIGNQGRTVFIREGSARLPIKALSTIDVPQMFNTRRLNDEVVRSIEQDFPGIFEHEVKFFTDRFNARRAGL
ncbi:MAG: hypothetical protein K0R58_11 [Ramlibacter sp.]|jgi:hypothetical protein|nr:hypothetical protein [Ramlibacter sp.]